MKCVICGNYFELKRKRKRKTDKRRLTCSPECSKEYSKRLNSEWCKHNRKLKKQICVQCEKIFYNKHTVKTCSKKCLHTYKSGQYKGREITKEWKQNMSIGQKNRAPFSRSTKDKMSKSHRGKIPINIWKRGTQAPIDAAKKALKSMKKKDTLPEKIVENFLIENNFHYVKQYHYKLGVADFYLPYYNTVVEVDGDYWHSLPKVKKRDARQTEYLKDEGYKVLRLKECDIKTGTGCARIIKRMIKDD